jgi:hypothetical protein
MHLCHTLAKALAAMGLPAYPLPPGRQYWMDVLACAVLSAVCEPVRKKRAGCLSVGCVSPLLCCPACS